MITAAEYARMVERQNAAELARGLKCIDRLSRRGLLRILNQESSKASTAKLRGRARLRWIRKDGRITVTDLYYAELADRP